nr:hypothetical protein [Nocardia terpenica]
MSDTAYPAERDGSRDSDHCRRPPRPLPPPTRGGADEPREQEHRKYQPGLNHLGLECETDEQTGQQQPSRPVGEYCRRHRVGGEHQQQNQQRVGDISAIQRDRDRCACHGRGCDEARNGSRDPANCPVQHQDCQHTLDRLRQHHRPDVRAEDPHRDSLYPEGAGQLVDTDGPLGVEGREEEVVPARRHRPSGGSIEDLRLHRADPPAVGHGGDCRDGPQRQRGGVLGRTTFHSISD